MFREQEHRQERIGLGMTLWPTGPTKVEEANEIEIGNLHESGGAHSGLYIKRKSRCERKMSYEQNENRAWLHCSPYVCLGWSSIGAGPEFKSNADDLAKIRSVLEEFRQDIIHKDGYALTKLVLNPDVLFHHTNTQEEIDSGRKYNAQFDGIGPSQLDGFAKLLATSKDKLEEKFRNIEIRQDGPLGW